MEPLLSEMVSEECDGDDKDIDGHKLPTPKRTQGKHFTIFFDDSYSAFLFLNIGTI